MDKEVRRGSYVFIVSKNMQKQIEQSSYNQAILRVTRCHSSFNEQV